jgi:virginiamycin B lyase
MGMIGITDSPDQPQSDAPLEDYQRFAQPLWQTALFFVLSFGFYLFPWAARCWRFVNAMSLANGLPLKRSAWGRPLTFLIPLYGWFYAFYRLAADVEAASDGFPGLPPGVLNAIVIASWIAGKLLPLPWALVGLVGAVTCVLVVQDQINKTCLTRTRGMVLQRPLSRWAYVGVPLGLCLWAGLAFLYVEETRPSTGVAAMRFGHDIDPASMTLLQPATHFGVKDHIVWIAHLNGNLDETSVRRTIDRQTGEDPGPVADDILTVARGDVHTLYEANDLSTLTSTPLLPGTYLVRFWRGNRAIAQGSFMLTGKPAYILYTLPTANAAPVGLARALDGSTWFTERDGNRIGTITPHGRIVEYHIPTDASYPLRITASPDGSLWFTEAYAGAVARITPSGRITEFALPDPNDYPDDLTIGPDHNIWFVEHNMNRIGVLTPRGAIREFPLGARRYPLGLVVGADRKLWFLENQGSHFAVASMTLTGKVTIYRLATSNADYGQVAAGKDGNIWFTEGIAGTIGRVSPEGAVSIFPIPNSNPAPLSITAASDGSLWFSEGNYALLGRITPDGQITQYRLPDVNGKPQPADILVAGPHDTLWATMPFANKVLQLDLRQLSPLL